MNPPAYEYESASRPTQGSFQFRLSPAAYMRTFHGVRGAPCHLGKQAVSFEYASDYERFGWSDLEPCHCADTRFLLIK